jgi:hypothetical protein
MEGRGFRDLITTGIVPRQNYCRLKNTIRTNFAGIRTWRYCLDMFAPNVEKLEEAISEEKAEK